MDLNYRQARSVASALEMMTELVEARPGRSLEIEISDYAPGAPNEHFLKMTVWSAMGSEVSSFEFCPEEDNKSEPAKPGKPEPSNCIRCGKGILGCDCLDVFKTDENHG